MWEGKSAGVIGGDPSTGTSEAFQVALERPECRASKFANKKGISSANASMNSSNFGTKDSFYDGQARPIPAMLSSCTGVSADYFELALVGFT